METENIHTETTDPPTTEPRGTNSRTNTRRPIKEKWIVNPNYPSIVLNPAEEINLTAQGLLTDPACQALGEGHREDPQVDQDTDAGKPGPK